jgi:hypothetical protein
VEELRAEQEVRDKERDSSLSKLMDEREPDAAKYQKELSVLQGQDRRIHACLSRLDDALLSMFSPFLLSALLLLFFLTHRFSRGFPGL